jgi:hypothetical protein
VLTGDSAAHLAQHAVELPLGEYHRLAGMRERARRVAGGRCRAKPLCRGRGAEHSKVGDKVILYLAENPNVGAEGSFLIVSAVYGRFILNAITGNYERPAEAGRPNFETRVPKSEMENALTQIQ